MKFLDPDTESAVRDFLARIPADIRLDQAILFGSRARGEFAIEDWLNPTAFPRPGFLRNVAREGIVL
jgi:hypothetical protein